MPSPDSLARYGGAGSSCHVARLPDLPVSTPVSSRSLPLPVAILIAYGCIPTSDSPSPRAAASVNCGCCVDGTDDDCCIGGKDGKRRIGWMYGN